MVLAIILQQDVGNWLQLESNFTEIPKVFDVLYVYIDEAIVKSKTHHND